MTTKSSKPRAGSRLIDAFLQSPLAGLTPWIVMALLSGCRRFRALPEISLLPKALSFATQRKFLV